MMKVLKLILFILLIVVIFLPFINDSESIILSDKVRNEHGGDYVKLSDEFVHYEISGADTAQVMVFIHGASGPMEVWDKNYYVLKDAGFKVLRYDLFGRGYSDKPDTEYNLELYTKQLSELLDTLQIKKPVILVGSSMGAIIASEFSTKYAERVKQVFLVAPAGFPLDANPLSGLLKYKFIGEYIMSSFGEHFLVEHNKKYFFEPENNMGIVEIYKNQMNYKGFKRSILYTMRQMPLQNYILGYSDYGQKNIPTTVIWGKQDHTFPYSNFSELQNAIPHAEIKSVENAAHMLQYERHDEINDIIITSVRNN